MIEHDPWPPASRRRREHAQEHRDSAGGGEGRGGLNPETESLFFQIRNSCLLTVLWPDTCRHKLTSRSHYTYSAKVNNVYITSNT
jgi:hypothetical protein